MNPDQKLQSAKTLASLLGVGKDEACERLRAVVQITWDAADPAAAQLGAFTRKLVERTISQVGGPDAALPQAPWELLINGAPPRCPSAEKLHARITATAFAVGPEPRELPENTAPVPRILALYAACYAAAQLCHYALGLKAERVNARGVYLEFDAWPGAEVGWDDDVDLGHLQVAGGGAVGNAFLYALQLLPVRGKAFLIDPKPINGGILNRCMWFDAADLGQPKVKVLAEKAGRAMPQMEFEPLVKTVKEARSDIGEFNCLVVGVDSRLARRNLQDEVPYEVFDASTTTVEEVVFHHNRQFDGHACMACIYFETEGELTFARHVAHMLNVDLEDVQRLYVDEAAATKIHLRYPKLAVQDLIGKAYDSLFRRMCASEQLTTPEQKQVLAPFAFVSQLAGTIMAIELYLRRREPERAERFNHWRTSPWRSPVVELQGNKARLPACVVCSRNDYQELADHLWANDKMANRGVAKRVQWLAHRSPAP